jgi:hypothetical protein
MSINWDDPAERLRLIEEVGYQRYSELLRDHFYKYSMRSSWLKKLSTFLDKHPVIFLVALTFFLFMLSGAVSDYSRACKKEWGSKRENNTKITVYEFNGIFCAFVRWIDKYEF